MLKRKSDWMNILTIATLLGFIYTAYSKAYAWDEGLKNIAEMRPKVENLQIQMAILVDRANSINQHVASIDHKTPR
jgi:hypothetical protein